MKKTMTSKKKAKEETENKHKIGQARSKKEVLNLRSCFFELPKSPREPTRRPREVRVRGGGPFKPVQILGFQRACVPALRRERDFEKCEERPRCKLKSSQVRL